MSKDLSKLKKDSLSKALDEIIEKIKVRDQKEYEYSSVNKKIRFTNDEEIGNKKRELNKLKVQKVSDFMSEEWYIRSHLKEEKIKKIDIKKLFRIGLLLASIIMFFAIIFNKYPNAHSETIVLPNYSVLYQTEYVFYMILTFFFLVLTLLLLSFKRIKTAVFFGFITMAIFLEHQANNFVFLITILGIASSFILMILLKVLSKIKFLNYRKKEIPKLKEKYKEQYEIYLTEKKSKEEEYKKKFEETKERMNNNIKLLNEKLDNLQKEKETLKKELSVAQDELNEAYSSLHSDYQDIKIILLFKEYLEKGRCDNLKECINLYINEKNMEKFQTQINDAKRSVDEAKKLAGESITQSQQTMNALSESNEKINAIDDKVSSLSTNVDRIDIDLKAANKRKTDRIKELYGEKAVQEDQKEHDKYVKEVSKDK